MKFLISLFVLIFPFNLHADSTFVSGTIKPQTWTLEGSPYCVDGNISVSGLIINPGVKVVFLGNFEFKASGKLTAKGTEQDSIIFTKPDTLSGWQGLLFAFTGTDTSELEYCRIEGSQNSGIRIDTGTPIIRKCTIANNSGSQGGGINVVRTSSFILDSCTVTKNLVAYN